MLSHIYRIATAFENSHGYRPNLLYINRIHYRYLSQQLDFSDMNQIRQLLGMEIILSDDVIHPHVASVRLYHQCTVA